jgi:hypothetical protein
METVIWIVQVVLAGMFLLVGIVKLTQPREELAKGQMAWTGDVTDGQLKALGVIEVLAAIGLILPAALGVVPIVTALAASGVVLLMIAASYLHISRGEAKLIPFNIVLGLMALFVAIERFGPHSL